MRQVDQALQVVHRQEAVHVRQHGAHAGRPRLELVVAQQRVQPDQLAAGLVQPLHFLRQAFARLAVEAVRHEQQAGVLAEQAPAPAPVEFAQAPADARAARPVLDRVRDARHRHVHVAVAQLAGDVGQARAEHENRDAVAVVGDGVQEMQEHARVGIHRAGDVAQHHQRRVDAHRRLAHQRNDVAAFAQRFPQRGAQIYFFSIWMDSISSSANQRQRQAQLAQHLLRLGQLGRRHGVEVHALQHLARGEGEARVHLDLLLVQLLLGLLLVEQGVRQALALLLLRLAGAAVGLGQQRVHHLLDQLRIAPEDAKGLVEDRALLLLRQEHGRHGPVPVVAPVAVG